MSGLAKAEAERRYIFPRFVFGCRECLSYFTFTPKRVCSEEQLHKGVVDPMVELVAVLFHGTDNSKSELLGKTEAALVSSTDASCKTLRENKSRIGLLLDKM